jgi:acyl-CoA synthetase (AMP-forming)/AMP-acid ligase II
MPRREELAVAATQTTGEMCMAFSTPSQEESEARLREAQSKIAEQLPDATLAAWWRERVDVAPERIVVRTDDRELTYREFDALVGKVVRWGRALELHHGDTVAIQLPAGPAFLALILGMAELGVRLSLLGTGLRGRSLRHALHEIPPRHVITTINLRDEIDRVDAVPTTSIHALAGTTDDVAAGLEALDALLASAPMSPPDSEKNAHDRPSGSTAEPDDTLFYIFTSGTTGLPKATR